MGGFWTTVREELGARQIGLTHSSVPQSMLLPPRTPPRTPPPRPVRVARHPPPAAGRFSLRRRARPRARQGPAHSRLSHAPSDSVTPSARAEPEQLPKGGAQGGGTNGCPAPPLKARCHPTAQNRPLKGPRLISKILGPLLSSPPLPRPGLFILSSFPSTMP